MTKFAVETLLGNDWDTVWNSYSIHDDGAPWTFETYEVAKQELEDHTEALRQHGMYVDSAIHFRIVSLGASDG